MRKFYSLTTFTVRVLMKLIWNYKVYNIEGLRNAKSCIIAANHLTWFDPPLIGSVTPFEIAYLAKSELFKYRFSSKFLLKVNAIPVKRNQTDTKAINDVLNVLNTGKSLLLFPQGGTNRTTIKPGVGLFAMKMKKDIVPVFVKNINKPFSCLFRLKKTMIIVGNPIKYETFAEWELSKPNYQKLAELVFSNIMELDNATN